MIIGIFTADERRRQYERANVRHLEIDKGIHIVTRGTPKDGEMGMSFDRPDTPPNTEFSLMGKITIKEAREYLPLLNVPEIIRDAYRRFFDKCEAKKNGGAR